MTLGFWQGIGIGFIGGIVVGFLLRAFFDGKEVHGELILAWVLATLWIIWHVIAALSTTYDRPPMVFDVVAGGAVGVIIGEKFFDYVAQLIGIYKK